MIIAGNRALTSLANLGNLQSIDDGLDISDNDVLTSIEGLENVQSLGQNLRFFSNALLPNLSGLDGLQTVDGNVTVNGNAALASLTGLENLQTVGGNLQVLSNDDLVSLAGLDGLQSIDGRFIVTNNDELAEVDALAMLMSVTGNSGDGLIFENNELLERCAVGLGPILAADDADDSVIGGANGFSGNGSALPGGTDDSDCNAEETIVRAFIGVDLPLTDFSLARGTCPAVLVARSGSLPCHRLGHAHRRPGRALHGVPAPRRAGRLQPHRLPRRDQAGSGRPGEPEHQAAEQAL